ncbi:MAG: hypothetical protein JW751_10445 [Polyangiaceae bacterium]|nr:hypothetical protein [Polyangiaceae bacterium]
MIQPNVDVANRSVEFDGTTYRIQELGPDNLAVLLAGVPVGRIVYSWGAANGISESASTSEETLTAIAEAWFAVADAG